MARFDHIALDRTLELARDHVRGRTGGEWKAEVLLTLGSGLGSLRAGIADAVEIPYEDIPGMHGSTAPGHAGILVAGTLEGVSVLCMQGRLHQYEGYEASDVVFPIRLARSLGARTALLTNATGAINESFEPGQVVLINDHINLTGTNPLIGPNDDRLGPRFPDMVDAYSDKLRAMVRVAASSVGYDLYEGVYLGVSGPTFETPAEIRAFRALGADLVGMSTVWETIAAVHCGMEVVGLSLVSNMAAGITGQPITESQIEDATRKGAADMARVVRAALPAVMAAGWRGPAGQ